jgi:hypothetical protein
MPKRLSLAVFAAVLFGFGLTSLLRAEPLRFRADAKAQGLGIGEYRVERTGTSLDVEVVDQSQPGRVMAKLAIDLDTAEGILMNLEKDGHRLRLTWSNEKARLGLTDLDTGESAARTLQIAKPHRMTQEGDPGLLERYDEEISFAMTVLDQTLTRMGLGQYGHKTIQPRSGVGAAFHESAPGKRSPLASPNLLPQNQYPPPATDSNCGPLCDGPYEESSVTIATARSRCCSIAIQDVHEVCSNGYCLSCCDIIGCDAACIGTTDYGCVCTANGQACSAPADSC